MNYLDFLRGKICIAHESGFTMDPSALSPVLKPHQRAAVAWALKGGRRALFESFGLGKTVQQLEWCRQVVQHEGGKALIVLPLGVRQEFRRDVYARDENGFPRQFGRRKADERGGGMEADRAGHLDAAGR